MTVYKDFPIHKIVQDKKETSPSGLLDIPTDGEVGFTIGGVDIDVKSTNCFCKIIVDVIDGSEPKTQIIQYFVKTGMHGFIFDPWGMFSEGCQAKEAKHMGRPTWNFSLVNEECFQYYFKFLQSQNKAWLLQAERNI